MRSHEAGSGAVHKMRCEAMRYCNAVLCCVVQCGACGAIVQGEARRGDAAHCDAMLAMPAMRCDAVRCGTSAVLRYDAMRFGTKRCGAVQRDALRCGAKQARRGGTVGRGGALGCATMRSDAERWERASVRLRLRAMRCEHACARARHACGARWDVMSACVRCEARRGEARW